MPKPRTKPPPQTTRDHLHALETTIRTLSYRHHLFSVFRHFVEFSALAFSNAADPMNKPAREQQYLDTVKHYQREEIGQFCALLGMLTLALEHEPTDVLGVLYHRLELQNEQRGQFFTPYPVCQAMAQMLVHDAKHLVEEKEFIRAQEPCVGSGTMVIALAQTLREQGINYQQKLHVVAVDIDPLCVHMAYVQCTMLHIPAIVCHGDTLRGDIYSQWRTFAHVMGLWDAKLARDDRNPPVLPGIEELNEAAQFPVQTASEALPIEPEQTIEAPVKANTQLRLF